MDRQFVLRIIKEYAEAAETEQVQTVMKLACEMEEAKFRYEQGVKRKKAMQIIREGGYELSAGRDTAKNLYEATVLDVEKTVNIHDEPVDKPTRPEYGWVYLIGSNSGLVKIGVSNDAERRLVALQSSNADTLRLLGKLFTKDRYSIEREIHSAYDDKRIKGEWFELDDDDIRGIFSEYKFVGIDT